MDCCDREGKKDDRSDERLRASRSGAKPTVTERDNAKKTPRRNVKPKISSNAEIKTSPIGITSVLIRAKPNGSTVCENFAQKKELPSV